MEWWQILAISLGGALLLFLLSIVLYRQFFKRFWDVVLSGLAIVVLSPLLLLLTVLGACFMRGNPFFTQKRPGKKDKSGNERIFRLVKFRTMSNKKGADGNLLPDKDRLNGYGRFLRSTSLDELPELFNIFVGQMSIVGPRPLLVEYLPWYTEEERHRHDVRPGLTGLSQIHGRNYSPWSERFSFDLLYVSDVSFRRDITIIIDTIKSIFLHSGIADRTQIQSDDNGKLFIIVNGERHEYPKPLDIERSTSADEESFSVRSIR